MSYPSSSDKSNRKSRNFRRILVEPFKQVKIGLYVISVVIVFELLLAWQFFETFSSQYQSVMDIFDVVKPEVKIQLITDDVFSTNAKKLAVLLVSFIAVLFAVIFRATHKIFGPIVSIGRFVSGIKQGDYSQRIIIRRGDELQSLVRNLNEMAEALEERHGARVGHLPERRKSDISIKPSNIAS